MMEISEKLPLIGVQDFLQEVDDIKQLITAYDKNLEKLNNIQDKLLKLSLTPEERESSSLELQRLRAENKEFRKSISGKIRLGWSRNIANGNYERIRSEKMTLLTEELNTTIQKSKVSEIHFQEKMRGKLVETMRLSDPTLTEDDIIRQLEESNLSECFSPGSMLPLTKEAKHQLDEITGRFDQIRQLEDDILELTDLFKEMKELVDCQGCKVDTIEDKIADAQPRVRDGTVNLGKAKDYFNRTMEKKRLLAITGLVVAFLLLIIIISLNLPQSSTDSVVATSTTIPATPSSIPATTITTTTTNPDICDPVADPLCVG